MQPLDGAAVRCQLWPTLVICDRATRVETPAYGEARRALGSCARLGLEQLRQQVRNYLFAPAVIAHEAAPKRAAVLCLKCPDDLRCFGLGLVEEDLFEA